MISTVRKCVDLLHQRFIRDAAIAAFTGSGLELVSRRLCSKDRSGSRTSSPIQSGDGSADVFTAGSP